MNVKKPIIKPVSKKQNTDTLDDAITLSKKHNPRDLLIRKSQKLIDENPDHAIEVLRNWLKDP